MGFLDWFFSSFYLVIGTITVLIMAVFAMIWFMKPRGSLGARLFVMGFWVAMLAYPLYTVWEEPMMLVGPAPVAMRPPAPSYYMSCKSAMVWKNNSMTYSANSCTLKIEAEP